ncbi:flippase-like domain-containing protein [Verrucomicrobia bacterium S94]|nr:flippase-like domain-containing protein [Verrucomicrobia bacterium S94]
MNQPELNLRKFARIAMHGLVITVIVSSLVLLFTSKSDTLKLLQENVHWPFVPLLSLPILLAWCCNGARFWLMTRCIGHPISYTRAWSIALSSEFGVMASPGGVGGAAVRIAFLKKSGISYVHGASLLAADVFMDMLFFISIIPLAIAALLKFIPFNSLSGTLHPQWFALLLLPALLYSLRKRILQTLEKQQTYRKYRMSGRLRLARINLTHGFRQGRSAFTLIFKNHRGILTVNYLLAATQFTARYSILPLAIHLLGTPVNPLPLIVMQGVLFMISMLVVAPGGGGSVELLAALVLPRLIPTQQVGVVILLWRIFTYHFYLLFGGIVFTRTFRKLM